MKGISTLFYFMRELAAAGVGATMGTVATGMQPCGAAFFSLFSSNWQQSWTVFPLNAGPRGATCTMPQTGNVVGPWADLLHQNSAGRPMRCRLLLNSIAC